MQGCQRRVGMPGKPQSEGVTGAVTPAEPAVTAGEPDAQRAQRPPPRGKRAARRTARPRPRQATLVDVDGLMEQLQATFAGASSSGESTASLPTKPSVFDRVLGGLDAVWTASPRLLDLVGDEPPAPVGPATRRDSSESVDHSNFTSVFNSMMAGVPQLSNLISQSSGPLEPPKPTASFRASIDNVLKQLRLKKTREYDFDPREPWVESFLPLVEGRLPRKAINRVVQRLNAQKPSVLETLRFINA